MALLAELRTAGRALWRARGVSLTIVVTLALGIGANAAVFTVVRGVLLRPLTNRGEDRLVYVRHSAPGNGVANVMFSMPEIRDLRARATRLSAFGEFSTISFSMTGLGEPRVVRAGVVNGTFFDVMGLRPALGRLLSASDDGPAAPPAVVLTHRFWSTALGGDRGVLGTAIRLDGRAATIVGVLEPTVPYPTETELIANVVTSPHHLDATMVDGRVHRMTEWFARLAPGTTVPEALADLRTAHAAMVAEFPEVYQPQADFRLDAVLLREQITAPARSVLSALMAASLLVFLVACANVANLTLARGVQREGEMAMRAALGARTGQLRRLLLIEGALLSCAGALVGALIAQPTASLLSRYAARFSVRALDVQVDATLIWTGAILALLTTAVLAFVPRLPNSASDGPTTSSFRISGGARQRFRAFAIAQVAAAFILLAGSVALLGALATLHANPPGIANLSVLAVDVPDSGQRSPAERTDFYRTLMTKVAALPGVVNVAAGMVVPWRDQSLVPEFEFVVEGETRPDPTHRRHARFRTVSPQFFDTLGVALLAGRPFND